jgi:predicted deacetylase
MADAKKVATATEHDESTQVREGLARIREELAALREQLAEAGFMSGPKAPQAPSFGMSEGTREELERLGKAVDPFTGKALTREDLKNE